MRNNKKLLSYLTVVLMTSISTGALAQSLQMRCPEVRDYGGYPHTTGNFYEYKLDLAEGMLFRRYGGGWSTICDKVSNCTFDKRTVGISEVRMDQKKVIDRQLDFLNRTEKTKEWSDIKRSRLVFGYESTCR